MSADIIPQSAQNLHDWLDNFLAQLPAKGPQAGLTPQAVTDLTTLLQNIKTPVDAYLAAQSALDAASGSLQQALADNLPGVRLGIKNLKTSKTYDDGIGAALQIIATTANFDAENYKPVITADAFPGYVRIKGKKLGADSFNIYMRLKGQTAFKLIATRRSKFPFDDDQPLAQPGVPEIREYQAIGILNDEEIGQPSDIVSVTYAG